MALKSGTSATPFKSLLLILDRNLFLVQKNPAQSPFFHTDPFPPFVSVHYLVNCVRLLVCIHVTLYNRIVPAF